MRNNQHTYELRRGFTLDDHFTGTLRDARRRGEMMATRLCDDVTLYAFNEPLSALREYGCYRLGARIADLRREGYNITTQHVSAISKITRRTVTFAKYTLINSSPA